MIEIAVGSGNPTKLRAAEIALEQCIKEPFKIVSYAVNSGVSDQPMSDEETLRGAQNRAYEAGDQALSASRSTRYALGMEGGVRVLHNIWFEVGWVCLYDVEAIESGYGGTPALRIPSAVRDLMERQNLEESQAVAAVYGTDTIASRDCSSIISGGKFTAERVYSLGVLAAFADLHSEA